MNWVSMKLGGEKHYINMNKPNKFLLNSVHCFKELIQCHLHPFSLYIKNHALQRHAFWWEEASH